jgi:glycerol-3-phosphate dehydrogenase (NAD(P)+)
MRSPRIKNTPLGRVYWCVGVSLVAIDYDTREESGLLHLFRENFAERVYMSGDDGDILNRVVDLLETSYYHASTSKDVIGIEVCAAFKNLYTIGVGSAKGRLERTGSAENGALMHNLGAALFSQAMAELSILVSYLGGDQASVVALAGAGDLYVTCQAGRNCRLGRLLGLGLTYLRAKADHMAAETIEGAELTLAVVPVWMR